MINWRIIGRKATNSLKIGQKMAGSVGKVLTKVTEVGNKIYKAADDATGGMINAVPGAGTVRAALTAGSHLGAALTGVGGATSVDGALHSLSSAYKGYKAPSTVENPAPGAENIVTASDDPA